MNGSTDDRLCGPVSRSDEIKCDGPSLRGEFASFCEPQDCCKTRDSPQQLRELTRGEREAVRRDGGGDGAAGQPERRNLFQRRNHFLEKLDLIEQRFERARKKTNVNVADATSRYLTNKVA